MLEFLVPMLVFREDKKKVKNLQTSIVITIIISFTSKKPVPDWPQKIVEQACCVPVITPPTRGGFCHDGLSAVGFFCAPKIGGSAA